MGERTPEKVIEKVVYREIWWEDWLAQERDRFSQWLGALKVLETRPQTKEWDVQFILWQKTFLETIVNTLWLDVRKLKADNEKLKNSLEERDKQITDILTKTQEWIKHYQPLLDEIDKQEKQFKKVKK